MLNTYYTEKIIGLKDTILEKAEEIQGTKHIYLRMEKRIHHCPRCGTSTSKVHDYRWQVIKDIPAYGLYTKIHLRKRRHVCPCCQKKFAESVQFLPKYQRTTNRLWAYALHALSMEGSMKHIARQLNLSQTTVSRILDTATYSLHALPKVLSIDEFRGNSGGEKFQCILTDSQKKKVLDILPSRKAEHLYAYFSSFPERRQVKLDEHLIQECGTQRFSSGRNYRRQISCGAAGDLGI